MTKMTQKENLSYLINYIGLNHFFKLSKVIPMGRPNLKVSLENQRTEQVGTASVKEQ